MPRTNKTEQQALDRKFIVAYAKYLAPANVTLNYDGVIYTPAQVGAAVEAQVDAQAKAETARGSMLQAVAQADATRATNKPIYDGAKQMVLVMYASNVAVLTEFGLSPRKKSGPKTVEVKQIAITKALATREARHTMGPKQKTRADFHEPVFPFDLAGIVDLSAVA